MSSDLDATQAKGSYSITDPLGRAIAIPKSAENDFAYFGLADSAGLRSYYDSEGYVVVRGLIDPHACDRAHAAFEREVKPSKSFIYRQATADPERNVFTEYGFMLNAIVNVHCVDPNLFPEFRRLGLEIITSPGLQKILRILFDEPGKLVQSMYFEGNPATWAHQDTYYLDSERIGAMTAAWFAVENIAPGAGRFYVYPKSHFVDMRKNGGDFDIAFNHLRYKELVKRVIEDEGFECRAPALVKGDVLFWNGKTIHGSLGSPDGRFSRRSFTGHYIPDSHRFLQFQSLIKPLKLNSINGMRVHHPKDLASFFNRSVLAAETAFPKPFKLLKRLAIKTVTAGRTPAARPKT
ncbi:MAG: phytanoyl-CoA dioxygenase family protein [Beijerinckiaceae bacterium]|nr:phytanoyl-CoA dioxygenase family protein [Beijerinckiaceae bacterium]MCI0734892.1 phytanoyl-CoA dioxygenase family protein [Beijerinckiaceae bacterium]